MCGRPGASYLPSSTLFAMDAKDGNLMDVEEVMAAPEQLSGC